MTIGELARRLRVTPRTLRHYEQLGLLPAETVDDRTGYRTYGAQQLLLGIQIEQLKAAGLSLATIRTVTGAARSPEDALHERRAELNALVAKHGAQLATIDALLAARAGLAEPRVVHSPAFPAVVVRTTANPETLGPTIRRTVQRLRREVRASAPAASTSFSARFPLEMTDGPISIEVAAHLDGPTPTTVTVPAETQLRVELSGPVALVPLAYEALLDLARERELPLGDTAVEHYLDLGAVGRTEVAVALTGR
jgi:DNA-binding transcriptional MerR regulator